MKKAGCSSHDKAQVRKFYSQGAAPEDIAAALRLQPEHVNAVLNPKKKTKRKAPAKKAPAAPVEDNPNSAELPLGEIEA